MHSQSNMYTADSLCLTDAEVMKQILELGRKSLKGAGEAAWDDMRCSEAEVLAAIDKIPPQYCKQHAKVRLVTYSIISCHS